MVECQVQDVGRTRNYLTNLCLGLVRFGLVWFGLVWFG